MLLLTTACEPSYLHKKMQSMKKHQPVKSALKSACFSCVVSGVISGCAVAIGRCICSLNPVTGAGRGSQENKDGAPGKILEERRAQGGVGAAVGDLSHGDLEAEMVFSGWNYKDVESWGEYVLEN